MGKKTKARRSPARSAAQPSTRERHTREQPADVHQPEAATDAGLDRHLTLYQDAVQSPKGDISYLLSFYGQYIGSKARSARWH